MKTTCFKCIEFWVFLLIAVFAVLGFIFLEGGFTGKPIQDISIYNCIDTDGGINPFVAGTLSSANLRGTDYCLTSDGKEVETCRGRYCFLKEYFCNNNGGSYVIRNCPKTFKPICNKGACVEPTQLSSETVKGLLDYSS